MLKPSMQGFKHDLTSMEGFPSSSDGKTSVCNVGDLGLIPGSGRSPGEGNGNLLQYSCLENSMDGEYSPWDHKESDTTEQLRWWLLAWEMSAIVWWLAHSLVLLFLGIGVRIDFFQSSGHCWVFQVFWHNESKILMASSFRNLNSSTGISSHPLALLIAVLLKGHLTLHSRMSGSGWLTTPSSNPVHKDLFYTVLPCILSLSSWCLQHLLGLYHFYPLLCPSLGRMLPWCFQFSWRDLQSFPCCCFLLLLSTVHWKRPSCLFKLFFGTLCLIGCTFPSLPCFSLLFILLLFVKPPQITALPSCFSFSLGWFCSPRPVLQTSVHGSSGTLLTISSPLNLFVTSTSNSYRIWLKWILVMVHRWG